MTYKQLTYLVAGILVILFGTTAVLFGTDTIKFPVPTTFETTYYKGTLYPDQSLTIITQAKSLVNMSAMRQCGNPLHLNSVCMWNDIFLTDEARWPGQPGYSSFWDQDGVTISYNTYTRQFSGTSIIQLGKGEAIDIWFESDRLFEVRGTISISPQIGRAAYYAMMFSTIMIFALGMWFGDIRLRRAKKKRS